jgi:hypothetical protein
MTKAGLGASFAPAYVLAKLPPLRSGENDPTPLEDRPFPAKWFSPYNGWTWYALEYDPETRECFGFVEGWEGEWGPFSLDEMESATGMGGKLPLIERDHYWEPQSLNQLRASGRVRP